MPHKTRKRGTERFRDERRPGGPRMHGGNWHDPDPTEQRLVEPIHAAAPDAVPEVESGGERSGMGAGGRLARKTKGRGHQLQPSARGKGQAGSSRR
jgi:hypothetical protein